MDCYQDFAYVYDTFMDQTPYEVWTNRILASLHEFHMNEGILLDLGCGTGNLTSRLAAKGYEMIGVDLSYDMLNVARERAASQQQDILFLCQDMREFELYGTVQAVVSVCDSINYILEEEELCEVFRLVNNYLDPQGIFIFDFNTVYKYKEVIGNRVIAENRDSCSFIWENYFDETRQVNEYDLTLFISDDEIHYEKVVETHYQKGYTIEQIKRLLAESGLEFMQAIDADTNEEITEVSERIYCIAREKGKA